MDQSAYPELSDELLAFRPAAPAAGSSGDRPDAMGLATRPTGSQPDLNASRPPAARPVPYTPPAPAPPRLPGREANVVEDEEFQRMSARLLGLDGAGGQPTSASGAQAETGSSGGQGSTIKLLPAVLGLGPPPILATRQPLRQTSSSSAIPLSARAAEAGTPPPALAADATLPLRARSASPPPTNIFAVPVTPLSPVFSSSPARTGRRASKAGRSPAAGSSAAVLSTPAQAAGLGPSVYGTAKDITLDEDPFAPASATSARHAAVMSSAGSTPGRRSSSGRSTAFDSDSSTSSSEDEPFPYPHHLRTRQNHTSPYPSGHDSPSSAPPAVGSAGIASHRHQASLPQDFVFSSPMSSSSGASSSLTADPDSTLPNGSSPRRPTPAHPPAPAGRALPKRSFARSISQPERSNILDRPPVFNTFVPDLPSYSEASVRASQPPGGIPRAEAPSSSGPEAGSSHRRRPGVRTTSLTMQRAQREAIEEKGALGRTALVTPPAIDSLPPLPPPEDERLGVDEADARSTAMTPVDEQRELLIRPLGLLALSQALSAANDEVDSLRATVRETTGLVVDQAYWVAQAAAAVQVQQVGGPLPLRPLPLGRQETCDARTLAEIDELSGSEAREALKILASTTTKSLAAISLVRTIHALVHSTSPSRNAVSPAPADDDDVFSDENLSMLEGTLVAWRRMARAGSVLAGVGPTATATTAGTDRPSRSQT